MIGIVFLLLACYCHFVTSKRYISAFLIFCLATAGFQMIPLSFLTLSSFGLSKSYDWLLIFLMTVLLFDPEVFLKELVWREFRNIKFFLFLLVFLLFYSVFYELIEFSVSFRVFRTYTFFLLIFVFTRLDRREIEKVFRLIVLATSIASTLYCLQLIVGASLLNNIIEEYYTIDQPDGAFVRYFNIPIFSLPVLFFLLFDRQIVSTHLKWWFALPNIMAIVLTQHRNLLFAMLFCVLIYFIFKRRLSMLMVSGLVIFSVLVFVGIDSIADNRLSQGFRDLQSSFNKDFSPSAFSDVDLSQLNTTEFRIDHFFERLHYISQKSTHLLFGLGLVTEDSQFVESLHFNVGIADATGRVTQVDTSDIAWSLFIIYFGIIGTILLVSIYLNLIKKFFRYRENDIMLVGVLYIISLFFTSFYGTTIIAPPTFCLLMLFAAYNYKLSVPGNNILFNEPN